MNGFTPGPWRVETTDRTQGDWKWREIVADDPDKGNQVVLGEAYVDGSGYPFDDHAEANARLIAAAPELYEALEGAAGWLDGEDMARFGPAELAVMRRLQNRINAALAKAACGERA